MAACFGCHWHRCVNCVQTRIIQDDVLRSRVKVLAQSPQQKCAQHKRLTEQGKPKGIDLFFRGAHVTRKPVGMIRVGAMALAAKAEALAVSLGSLAFAEKMDAADKLAPLRGEFLFPTRGSLSDKADGMTTFARGHAPLLTCLPQPPSWMSHACICAATRSACSPRARASCSRKS